MTDYGSSFIAAVDGTGGLHWSLRPFWQQCAVVRHGDGVSVRAVDDLGVRTELFALPTPTETTIAAVGTSPESVAAAA